MAIVSKSTVTITRSGDGSSGGGTWTHTVADSVAVEDVIDLVPGDNTITLRSGAQRLTIKPPTANTQALKLKGNAGDTGWSIRPNVWTSLGVADTPGTLILYAAGPVLGVRLLSE
jgi:hypothetical protein